MPFLNFRDDSVSVVWSIRRCSASPAPRKDCTSCGLVALRRSVEGDAKKDFALRGESMV